MEQTAAWIAGWEHTTVVDEPIDRAGLPFADALFVGRVPAEVDAAAATLLPAADLPIGRISDFHRRSYEVGDAGAVKVVWGDRHGNSYTSLSYKGDNLTEPGIVRSLTAPSGFIPLGLQEGDALLRVLISSRVLRSHHIPTEWVVGVSEPSVLPFHGELVDQAEYKRRLLGQVLGTWSVGEAAEIARAIEPMTFFVTARCMEINDRPLDFLDDESAEQMTQRLDKIFTVYNLTHRRDPDFRELDVGNDADCRYYFTTLLPTLQGRNLGKLHDIGLIHKFPVPGNVTALGGIIDLDSIHGVPLGIGDETSELSDFLRDAGMVFERGDRSYVDMLRHVAATTGWFDEFSYDLLFQMQQNFLEAYCSARSQDFSDTERGVFFLAMNRSEHQGSLALQAFAHIRGLLAEQADLVQGVHEELRSFIERQRMEKVKNAQAYSERRIDMMYEDGLVPKEATEADGSSFMQRLISLTLTDVEVNTIFDSEELLAAGGVSTSFDALAERLGLAGEEYVDMRGVLARAFFSPETFFELAGKGVMNAHMETVAMEVSEAIKRAIAPGRARYRAMSLNREGGEEEDLEPIRKYYYHRFPYQVITSFDLDDLREILGPEADDGLVAVHDETAGDAAVDADIRALPVMQYITDATRITVDKVVSPEGEYRHVRTASEDQTYEAEITIADENGVVHAFIRKMS